MASVICLDTEPETIEALRQDGHTVEIGEIGYRTGRELLVVPPHECDLLICDLKKPACFNATHWGPGQNDNFRCKIEEVIDDTTFSRSGRHLPVYALIQSTQIKKKPVGTFGPSDIFRAVDQGGVPLVLFLNPEWLRHVVYPGPNFFEVFWKFERTKASKLLLTDFFKEAFPESENPSNLALPLEFHILETRLSRSKEFLKIPLMTNTISQEFGEVIILEKGSIWALPQFIDNAKVCKGLLNRLDSFIKFQSSILGKDVIESKQIPYEELDIRDAFISYASEDREKIALPIAEALKDKGLSIWFDEHELTLGDSLRAKIEEGLKISRFGVTILSHHFFKKRWPQMELDGLLALEKGTKKILPIWHELSEENVREYSPILAGRLGIPTSKGIDAVAEAILKAVKAKK